MDDLGLLPGNLHWWLSWHWPTSKTNFRILQSSPPVAVRISARTSRAASGTRGDLKLCKFHSGKWCKSGVHIHCRPNYAKMMIKIYEMFEIWGYPKLKMFKPRANVVDVPPIVRKAELVVIPKSPKSMIQQNSSQKRRDWETTQNRCN